MNFGLQSLVSDISVSMFKVAAVISHPRLKSELETLAVSMAVDPCLDNIFSAENLINLGRETGDIKPINAIVLIRELENLRKSLSAVPLNSQIADIDISSKFAHKNQDTIAPPSVATVVSLGQVDKPAVKVGQVKPLASRDSDGVKRTPPGRKSFLNSDKDRVYQYIVGHKEVKLKELESVFNEVSGRTVRRVTESLMKEGKIERVGSPGPTSFYRLISPSSRLAVASPVVSAAPIALPASVKVAAPAVPLPVAPSAPSAPAASSVFPAVVPAKEEIQNAGPVSFQQKLASGPVPAPARNPDAGGFRAITRADEPLRHKAESQSVEQQTWIPASAGMTERKAEMAERIQDAGQDTNYAWNDGVGQNNEEDMGNGEELSNEEELDNKESWHNGEGGLLEKSLLNEAGVNNKEKWDGEEENPPIGEDEDGMGGEQDWVPVFPPETSMDEDFSQSPQEKPVSTTGETPEVIRL